MDLIYFTENFFLLFLFVATFFFQSQRHEPSSCGTFIDYTVLLWWLRAAGDAARAGGVSAGMVPGCGGDSSSTDFHMLVCHLVFSSMTNAEQY